MGAVWNLESNEIQLHLLNLAHEGEGTEGVVGADEKEKGCRQPAEQRSAFQRKHRSARKGVGQIRDSRLERRNGVK